MSFLDEGKFAGRLAVPDFEKDPEARQLSSQEKQDALKTLKSGGSVTVEKKSKKRPDYADVDGDGNKTEPMAKAFKDKEAAELDEGAKDWLVGLGLTAAAIAGLKALDNNDPVIKAIKTAQEQGLVDTPEEKKWAKDALTKRGVWLDIGKGEGGDISVDDVKDHLKEEKTIELPANTKFTLDLKHLTKKHGKEKSIKLTKNLMKKLHDKGKVNIDGTTLVFEMDVPEQEPPARDYLGDDGKDYEGGMAKSQLLKMKKYAVALCDMVDDESQLEAWVQAKITKASEYMSAVYHYLDYQNSKMNESALFPRKVPKEEWKQLGIEWEMTDYNENRPDYQEGPLHGTTKDGREFESNGYHTEYEGIVVDDDVYEVTPE